MQFRTQNSSESCETLQCQYGCSCSGQVSIAQGPGKVQGLKFEEVELETRKKETIVDYVNKVKDVANDETNQNPNESSENATVAGDRTDSED